MLRVKCDLFLHYLPVQETSNNTLINQLNSGNWFILINYILWSKTLQLSCLPSRKQESRRCGLWCFNAMIKWWLTLCNRVTSSSTTNTAVSIADPGRLGTRLSRFAYVSHASHNSVRDPGSQSFDQAAKERHLMSLCPEILTFLYASISDTNLMNANRLFQDSWTRVKAA